MSPQPVAPSTPLGIAEPLASARPRQPSQCTRPTGLPGPGAGLPRRSGFELGGIGTLEHTIVAGEQVVDYVRNGMDGLLQPVSVRAPWRSLHGRVYGGMGRGLGIRAG
jgi:hypothetical protein